MFIMLLGRERLAAEHYKAEALECSILIQT